MIAACLIGWAISIGALPTHQVYSRLPSVDWGFFVKHAEATAIGLALLVGAAVIGLIVYLEYGGARHRAESREASRSCATRDGSCAVSSYRS